MLNGTAKISVTDYDEGGFVINDVVCDLAEDMQCVLYVACGVAHCSNMITLEYAWRCCVVS